MKIRVLALTASLLAVQLASAATITENFATDPASRGWQSFGESSLFNWDSDNGKLAVTWDSSQVNSYYYRPLGTTLTKSNSFVLEFDLNLFFATASGYFELAIGLCNYTNSTSTNFSRANVVSPNLFEFDYYPPGETSWGPSIDATLVDANSLFYFTYDATRALENGVVYHVILEHPAGTSLITGRVLTNGVVFTALPSISAWGADDFNLDTLAICNYTTQDDTYGDMVLAQGTVDNFLFASPMPLQKINSPAAGQVEFISNASWLYTLEQSTDLQTWTNAAPASFGNDASLVLQATNAAADRAFYRVRAELP